MRKILMIFVVLICIVGGVFVILWESGMFGESAGGRRSVDNDITEKSPDVSDNADAADKTTSETIDPNADEKPVDTTETTEDAVSELVDKTMAEMSLHDKVCQMMFVTPEGLTGTDDVMVAGDATKQAL